jgi:nucleoside-triphosphatase
MEDQILVVIDEIGPMEIYSEVFRTVVMSALSADVTLFGTIVKRSVPFADQVKVHPRVKLFEVTRQNRESLLVEVNQLFDSE